MMTQQIKIELLVRGLANKSNNCIDLILPTKDEESLKIALKAVCDNDNSVCCVVKTKCNCKIKIDDKVDIFKLNQKLIELNEHCSSDEATTISEYISMKKSTIDNYYCKEQEGVTIDEIYEYVICIKLDCYYNALTRIFDKFDEHFGISNRFERDEILSKLKNEELVKFLVERGYCTMASPTVIEKNKKE